MDKARLVMDKARLVAPSPTLPRKRGREHTEFAARSYFIHTEDPVCVEA
jgi:hypothetical protein